MTIEEAYRKGQEDMRRRVLAQWAGWHTDTLGGMHRLSRPGRKGYSDVVVRIRRECRVQPLERVA